MRFKVSILNLALIAMLVPVSPSAYADPPSWAPAHGWRKKHDPYYTGYTGRQWSDDYGISIGRCNREAVATAVGGVIGGVVGSTVGKGDGRTVAIILGSVLGAVIGNKVGKEFDNADRGCLGHALELGTENRPVAWLNPDNGLNYQVTPLQGFQADGHQCRNYQLSVTGRGMNDSGRESACQTSDGTWQPYRRG